MDADEAEFSVEAELENQIYKIKVDPVPPQKSREKPTDFEDNQNKVKCYDYNANLAIHCKSF